jgi:hypothetical protein
VFALLQLESPRGRRISAPSHDKSEELLSPRTAEVPEFMPFRQSELQRYFEVSGF